MATTARAPSRHPIFFPSAYDRPWYEMPISYTRTRIAATFDVSSGSTPNRSSSMRIRSRISRRNTL